MSDKRIPDTNTVHPVSDRPCKHEWVVYSTALTEGWLMLQCVQCGTMGTVDDPSKEEWGRAFHSPSRPYRWHESSRVTIRHKDVGEFYVVKAEPEPSCKCVTRIEGFKHPEYERVPVEITHHAEALSAQEKDYLEELASWVSTSDICSLLFPVFIDGMRQIEGSDPPAAAQRIAAKIDSWSDHGGHFSPKNVAVLLRGYANASQRKARRRRKNRKNRKKMKNRRKPR
ncbi:MAG: hypothetical protein HQ567_24450 [Candidatus Nealsonbacteria bacterium]|nr:hypothetical protein [Candidatus Nealsonbacteria bacterium]